MKKVDIGNKNFPQIIEYYNPIFKQIEVEGDITQFTLESKYNSKGEPIEVKKPVGFKLESRKITLCFVSIPYSSGIINNIGIAIMNPEDKDGELGKNIAEGRAIKSPIQALTIMSSRRLPRPIINEMFIWATKHVERNLDNFVNDLRETLRNE